LQTNKMINIMKRLIILTLLFVCMSFFSMAQSRKSNLPAIKDDSVKIISSLSATDELFLFKNHECICHHRLSSPDTILKNKDAQCCPFHSIPENFSFSATNNKLRTSVMMAQIR